MEIKIGIIGPCDVVQAVMELGEELAGVVLEPLIYEKEEEAPLLAKDFEGQGDVIIFTGLIPLHKSLVNPYFRRILAPRCRI